MGYNLSGPKKHSFRTNQTRGHTNCPRTVCSGMSKNMYASMWYTVGIYSHQKHERRGLINCPRTVCSSTSTIMLRACHTSMVYSSLHCTPGVSATPAAPFVLRYGCRNSPYTVDALSLSRPKGTKGKFKAVLGWTMSSSVGPRTTSRDTHGDYYSDRN